MEGVCVTAFERLESKPARSQRRVDGVIAA